ncbi:lysozyme inhibitor LprI family protein [Falsiroseomonas sp. HW251]|uniref:lysozyme inhibitor LprI family protein n=1 Tax=Falsiroseomonas sp. HW251 TaxID=3390998 RepID=UPI003D319378
MHKPITRLLAGAVLACAALAATPPSQAASFDCAAARAPAERMICASPELDTLDLRLAELYRRAIESAPWRRALREAQRIWLTGPRDAAAAMGGPPALAAEYRTRVAALEGELARATAPGTLQPEAARARGPACLLPMPVAITPEPACRVRESGSLPIVAGQRFTYAVYDYGEETRPEGSGVLVFGEGALPGRLRLLIADLHPDARCETPRVIGSSGRAVLQVPCVNAGTQAANDESVFGWNEGEWRELDVRSWRREFLARVPRDLSVRRGVYPDYGSMTARSPLWGAGDGDCCAAHGSIEADLAWNGDRLAMRAVRVLSQTASAPRDRGDLMPILARLPDPSSLARHPAVREALAGSLGPDGARQIAERLAGPSGGLDVVAGRWVAGSACMPHACSVEETFLAYDTRSGTALVASLRDGKAEILTPSPPWPAELVDRVHSWAPGAATLLGLAASTKPRG